MVAPTFQGEKKLDQACLPQPGALTTECTSPGRTPIQAVVVRQVDKEGTVVDPASYGSGESGSSAPLPTRRELDEREGVFVVSGGEAAFRAVKTGILGETDIEILEGLKEGDEIVSGSYKTLRTLKDKAKVKPEEKEKRS